MSLFVENRLKFNDAFFVNGDTRHVLSDVSVNGIGWTKVRLVRLESTQLLGLTAIGGNR
jgi:hypothetical protein